MTSRRKRISVLILATILVASMLAFAGCGEKKTDEQVVVQGETTIIENTKLTPDKYSAKEQVYVIAGVLKNSTSFRSDVTGKTVSKMPKYTQNISDTHIKNGSEAYNYSKSTSILVNMGKEAFFSNGKVVFRDAENINENKWSDTLNVTTFNDYRSSIGVDPTALSSYILNNESITNATSEKLDNGDYKVTCVLDQLKATPYYAIKMRAYGGLQGLPTFSSCRLEIIFGENWIPKTMVSKDVYTIQKGILTMECESLLTETFTGFNETQEIPNVELFRAKVGDPAENIEETATIEGSDLLFNTILQMDTNNGVKISGSLTANVDEKELVLPVDGWMRFDFTSFPADNLLKVFTGRVSTNLAGIPVNITYIGDGFLYINISTTKYKYSLVNNENPDASMDSIANSIVVNEDERNGEFRHFNLTLKDDLMTTLSKKIEDAVIKLPEGMDMIKGMKLNDLNMSISLKKETKKTARIVDVIVNCNLETVKGTANVLIAEKPEILPTQEELADYVEADWNNLVNNFKFIGKIINGVNAYDWATGNSFVLSLGLASDSPDVFGLLELPFNMEAQSDETNGLSVHLNFELLKTLKKPGDIYYKDGNIYMITFDETGIRPLPANVEVIKLADKVGGLLPLIGGAGAGLDIDSVIATLANLALNSNVTINTLENGVQRMELYLPKDISSVVSVGYQKIWDTILNMDLSSIGPMAGLVKALLGGFNFAIDDVIIRTEFTENTMTSFSLRLRNEKTSDVGKGKDVAFVVEMTDGKKLEDGQMDNIMSHIDNGLEAMEESKNVRAEADKIINEGLQYIGDSYNDKLVSFENNYAGLSERAKVTVLNYSAVMAIKKQYNDLRADADKFLTELNELINLMELDNNAETYEYISGTIKPHFDKTDIKVKEYLGKYVVNKFLSIVDTVEKNYAVLQVIDSINALTTENYPDATSLDNAIKACEKKYDLLTDTNKKLVTNLNKIEDAKNKANAMKLTELNETLAKLTTEAGSLTENSTKSEINAVKTKFDNANKQYNALSAEDKKLITNYTAFETEYKKFDDRIHTAEIKELNSAMLKFITDTESLNENSQFSALNKAKTDAENLIKKYNALAEEDKSLITANTAFMERYALIVTYTAKSLNASMPAFVEKVNAITMDTQSTDINKIKTDYKNMDKCYNSLGEEQKKSVTNYNDFVKSVTDKFNEAFEAIGGLDNVVAGDECFNKINYAKAIKGMLNSNQITELKEKLTELSKCENKHIAIEVDPVKNVINSIGKVEYTTESYDRIVNARNLYINLRTQYKNKVNNAAILSDAEANYVKASFGNLSIDNITVEDEQKLADIKAVYDTTFNAYGNLNNYFVNGIKNKIACCKNYLEKLNTKLAELKAQ